MRGCDRERKSFHALRLTPDTSPSPWTRHGSRVTVPSALGRMFRAWGLKRVISAEQVAGRHGSYLLLLRIPFATITVGALGSVRFAPGLYGYVGSAMGKAATLGHRLARHVRRGKALRWHIDYVTLHPGVMPVSAFVSVDPIISEERLARLCAGKFAVIAGFGNSDLKKKTPGHLFLLRPVGSPALGDKRGERGWGKTGAMCW